MASARFRSGGKVVETGDSAAEYVEGKAGALEAGDAQSRDRGAEGAAEGPADTSDETGALVSLSFGDDELPPADVPGPPPPIRRTSRARGRRMRSDAGRPRGPTSPQYPSKAPAAKTRAKNAPDPEAARAVLTLAEGGLSLALGDRAKLLPRERVFIEPPLANLMGRLNEQSAARVSALTDPLLLGIGLLMYGLRLFGPEKPRSETPPSRPSSPASAALRVPQPPASERGDANGSVDLDDEIARIMNGAI